MIESDVIIVGGGPVGCVLAERISNILKLRCVIIEKRNHIAGNCYDEKNKKGVRYHKYGPHYLRFKNKKTFFAMTAHIIFKDIDSINTVTHSNKLIKIIRNKIGFKNILISDDLSMKSLKDSLKENTIRTFRAGCNIALHCNANLREMEIVAKNSPLLDKFIVKKTSQFYKILS